MGAQSSSIASPASQPAEESPPPPAEAPAAVPAPAGTAAAASAPAAATHTPWPFSWAAVALATARSASIASTPAPATVAGAASASSGSPNQDAAAASPAAALRDAPDRSAGSEAVGALSSAPAPPGGSLPPAAGPPPDPQAPPDLNPKLPPSSPAQPAPETQSDGGGSDQSDSDDGGEHANLKLKGVRRCAGGGYRFSFPWRGRTAKATIDMQTDEDAAIFRDRCILAAQWLDRRHGHTDGPTDADLNFEWRESKSDPLFARLEEGALDRVEPWYFQALFAAPLPPAPRPLPRSLPHRPL
eukprot:tig00020552_g10473.t1